MAILLGVLWTISFKWNASMEGSLTILVTVVGDGLEGFDRSVDVY